MRKVIIGLSVFAFFALASNAFATKISAGGGPVSFTVTPTTSLNPGEQYTVEALVDTENSYPYACKNCYIKLGLQNPQDNDYISQNSDYTDENGRIYAKIISYIPGPRTVIVKELIDSTKTRVEAYSYVTLNYTGTAPEPPGPEYIYPHDGQTLDLEGAYMFKVKPVDGASGYLFGFFQDGVMTYENYRDERVLSGNGEFALWESNPWHSSFHSGPVTVKVRALMENGWTNTRDITIYLKPRQGGVTQTSTTIPAAPVIKVTPPYTATPSSLPVIESSSQVPVINDSSASAALQKKVDELQKQLQESQNKQSVLEQRLNDLMRLLRRLLPFLR